MAEKPKEYKRLNRSVGVAEALKGALDPALKRRGFASRDIITYWSTMAPAPYDKVALPDKLVWPRGERSAEGATLHVRCAASHALGLAHEGAKIAASVNRYFGYLLVGQVRLSAEPFRPHSAKPVETGLKVTDAMRMEVSGAVESVEDEGLKEALRQLGHGIMAKSKSSGR
ncbi:DUF721 domain-containing protein [Paradevosia shaoguanensis]|uniref:DUF721 domain-containing protein n=1 Tax=Paradevosia shaoguanensis TaxID=1335043 RepID=UPI000455CA6A|nr:DciA family protein [Paradevosia shaoguanensis]MBI4045932.1 DUF721 domain-containing protein [Devosia nanyangense]CDP51636.1 hypothetical protein [Devosia sp. DBB001]